MLVGYAYTFIYQVCWEIVSKLYRNENASEFACDVISSLILVVSAESKWSLFLLIVFALRGYVYYKSRRILLRDFLRVEYFRIAITILEMATILLRWLTVLTVELQLVHSVSVVSQNVRATAISSIRVFKISAKVAFGVETDQA